MFLHWLLYHCVFLSVNSCILSEEGLMSTFRHCNWWKPREVSVGRLLHWWVSTSPWKHLLIMRSWHWREEDCWMVPGKDHDVHRIGLAIFGDWGSVGVVLGNWWNVYQLHHLCRNNWKMNYLVWYSN